MSDDWADDRLEQEDELEALEAILEEDFTRSPAEPASASELAGVGAGVDPAPRLLGGVILVKVRAVCARGQTPRLRR